MNEYWLTFPSLSDQCARFLCLNPRLLLIANLDISDVSLLNQLTAIWVMEGWGLAHDIPKVAEAVGITSNTHNINRRATLQDRRLDLHQISRGWDLHFKDKETL
jgi:hypothetical protein